MADTIKLEPGDKVLLNFGNDDWNEQEVQEALDGLRERFPDVEFTALAGADQVIVQKADSEPLKPPPADTGWLKTSPPQIDPDFPDSGRREDRPDG